MTKKFDPIRSLVAELEARAEKMGHIKANTTVGSYNDVSVQITALKAFFRRMRINHMVTCKIGLWYKRMPVVDVIVDFKDLDNACRNGEEAGEMSKLMQRAFAATRKIMAAGLPKMDAYCPEVGVVCNGWRFQC